MHEVIVDENKGDDGVEGYTTGEIYVCHGSMTSNGDSGWYLGAYYVTLDGVFAFGNGVLNGYFDDIFGAGADHLIIHRSCP